MSELPFYGLVQIASLPSKQDLQNWQGREIQFLLNLSGIDLFELHSRELLAPFGIAQFHFADVFTQHTQTALPTLITSEPYLHASSLKHQQALRMAVQTLLHQLEHNVRTCVFCHRGLGRSPLVTAAAFQRFYRSSPEQAIARTQVLQPSAIFTALSRSALCWCAEQIPYAV